MSYILEALADSEQARRQLAAVPQYSLLPAVGEDMPQQRVWPYVVAGALLVNVVGLQLWMRPALPEGAATLKVTTATPSAANLPPAAAGAHPAPAAQSDKPVADATDPVSSEADLPLTSPDRAKERGVFSWRVPVESIPRTASLNAAGDSAAMPQMPKLTPQAKAKQSVEATVATAVTPIAAAAKATPTAVVPVAITAPAGGTELPPALQQELPVLIVAGFIRDEGSGGLVIVNDRLAREGDEVAPGVKLEKIAGDSLVFNYKGYRFKR